MMAARRARIVSAGFSESMRPVISLELDRPLQDDLRGQELDLVIDKHREHRSLRQNAYYWQLLEELRAVMGWTRPEAHNRMLRQYGQVEIVAGKVVYIPFPDTDEVEAELLQTEAYHVAPTSDTKEEKGRRYRWYLMLRGSSTYDTQEMSRLVDGLVEEAKEVGIETLTPDDLAKMRAYEQQAKREKGRA